MESPGIATPRVLNAGQLNYPLLSWSPQREKPLRCGFGSRYSVVMVNMAALASSFQGVGAEYDLYRPGFPVEVLDMVAAHVVENALDLGAGTGKFTELLVSRARHVTAVDPSQAMLSVLADKLPQVATHVAPAEQIPVATASQDLVTVAQAFHWFDREPVCAEISRVLRPGGHLALLWNNPDPACSWDRAAYRVAHPGLSVREVSDTPRAEALPQLQSVSAESFRWEESISRQDYLRRWLTVSSFLAAGPSEREDMLARVAQILDEDHTTAGCDQLTLPHVTEVLLYRRPAG